jgi:HSP20 family protein
MPATEVNVKETPEKMTREGARWPAFETGFFPRNWFNMHPNSLMKKFADEMDQFFYGNRPERGVWSPAVELKEEPGKFRLMAELPGLKPEDVKVGVTEDAVNIEGERKYEKEEKREGFYHTERSYGRFYRSIPLPKGADAEKVSAAFNNGILEVTIPVPEIETEGSRSPGEDGRVNCLIFGRSPAAGILTAGPKSGRDKEGV